jgi:hypothetical protein
VPSKIQGNVLRAFSGIFPQLGGLQAPAEISIEAPVQPVADMERMARYAASPGVFDGWWVLTEAVQVVGAGSGSSNKNPWTLNQFPGKESDRVWVYGAWAELQSGNLNDIVGAGISYAQAAAPWKIDTTGPAAAQHIFLATEGVQLTGVSFGALINRLTNGAGMFPQPFPILNIGTAQNITFQLVTSGSTNLVHFTLLLRILPAGVNP